MLEQGRSASLGGKFLESLISKIGSAAEHVKNRRAPALKQSQADSSDEDDEDEQDSGEDYHSSEDEFDGDDFDK